jgi:hypothetical protein
LPQPAHEFLLGRSPELGEMAVGLQERVLDQIIGIDLALQAAANLQPGQECQVVVVQLQEPAQGRTTSRTGLPEQLLRF